MDDREGDRVEVGGGRGGGEGEEEEERRGGMGRGELEGRWGGDVYTMNFA